MLSVRSDSPGLTEIFLTEIFLEKKPMAENEKNQPAPKASDATLLDFFAAQTLLPLLLSTRHAKLSGDWIDQELEGENMSVMGVARYSGWNTRSIIGNKSGAMSLADCLAMECYEIAEAMLRERENLNRVTEEDRAKPDGNATAGG